MVISLHSHSGQFCKHAVGTLEEVVQAAIARGFVVYGLSEHMPRHRAQDLYPEEIEAGLSPEDLDRIFTEYVAEARRLKEKYVGQIRLLLGMETDLISEDYLDVVRTLRERHGLEYIVGSVHHVDEHPIDFSAEWFDGAEARCGGTESIFIKYFDAQHRMITALTPEVIGHFDLVRLFRPQHPISDEVWARIVRNVDAGIAAGSLFEINASAYRKKLPEAYPQRDILQLILRKGGRVTLSDDSHGPAAVGLNYSRLHGYLTEMDVRTVFSLLHSSSHDRLQQEEMKDVLASPFWTNS